MISRWLPPISRMFSTNTPTSIAVKSFVESTIEENKITIFSKSYCDFCHETKSLFIAKFRDVPVKVCEVDRLEAGPAIQSYLIRRTGQRTFPNVFINKQHIGGNDAIQAAFKSGKLATLIKT